MDLKTRIKNKYHYYSRVKPYTLLNKFNSTKKKDNIQSISVFSTPRGASTWLAELLNNIVNSTLVLEPLYRGEIKTNGLIPKKVKSGLKKIRDMNFYYYQPIPKNAAWKGAYDFFSKLFNLELMPLSIYFNNIIPSIIN